MDRGDALSATKICFIEENNMLILVSHIKASLFVYRIRM